MDNKYDKSGFEKFVQKNYRIIKNARASISSWGIISLNKAAIQEFLKTGQKYCNLFFDEKRRRIGIQPISEPEKDSFKISLNEAGNYAVITANSFLRFYGILPKEDAFIYEAIWDEDVGMIIIDAGKNWIRKKYDKNLLGKPVKKTVF